MRILYFSRDYTPHDHRFLAALAQTEHVVYYLRLENSGRALEDRPVPAGVTLVRWAGGQSPAKFRDGPRLLLGLKRVINDINPDLIHAGPVQRSAFLVALTGFQPLVTMSWGYDLLVDAARNRWWTWATRYTLKRSAAFVGDCDTIRDLATGYGMNAENIVTFPWGTDIDHFTPSEQESPLRQQLGWGADQFVVISTRSWAPIYGVEEVAHAFVKAAHQHPEMRLLMLGKGQLAPRIRRTFTRAQIIDRVHFPGHVTKAQLPEYYRAADLYVSASHSDGSSISLLEALACGTPVLLSDISGNREWVPTSPSPPGRGVRGEGGWLFREGDVDHLAASLHRAVRERAKLPEMGRRARLLAEQRANWEQNFPKLLDAYQIALEGEIS
ncbi:MAG: Alpha-monoglucosyldiacylglycerol synthase [Chloroflexi bacterium]|nr:Alpha-monoglucosyldiacylglycerol synthase [Chloroflexota bacterium]